jgi:hypothetical protein
MTSAHIHSFPNLCTSALKHHKFTFTWIRKRPCGPCK